MKIKWTEEQAQALYAKRANLLVSAAAGSGKTQVLSGRILRRIIEENVDINSFLIVTFTKAAASEMRERIAKNISEALTADPKNKHLKRQLTLIPAAHITTIHSFCLDIVKNHFIEAELEAGFLIAEDGEAALLKAEAAEEALSYMYENYEGFADFTAAYSSQRRDDEIADLGIAIYDFAESMPFPMEWVYEKCQEFQDYENVCDYLINRAKSIISRARERAMRAVEMFPECEVFNSDIALLSKALNQKSWDSLREVLLEKFDRFSYPKNGGSKEAAKSLRDDVKSLYEHALTFLPCSFKDAEITTKISEKAVRALCAFVECFEKRYTERKRARGLLDFSDIEHIAINLLTKKTENGYEKSDIAKKLSETFDEIYIDEYQDSNKAQELIFQMLQNKNNIFMVGDAKQSIYGFRNTSAELFMEKFYGYSQRENAPKRKVCLSKNFRSRPEILDFVNGVFLEIMTEKTCGINYKNEQLFAGADYPEKSDDFKKQEINIIELSEDDESSIIHEARFAAKRIKELMDKEVYDIKTKTYRAIRYSDIAILLRAPKGSAAEFEKCLMDSGIPAYADVGGGFFDAPEVETFIALLTVIDNSLSDIPLISVLRSPIFDFSEDELTSIRLTEKKVSFKKAIKNKALEDDALALKCKNFLEKIDMWRSLSKAMSVDEFIWYLFDNTGYMAFVGALPQGQMRMANLNLLFEKARQFENSSFKGLFNFLNYISRVREKSDTTTAKMLDESHNVVRIMSIHKSKGLEFPVVILAGCGKKFNKRSVTGKVLLHKNKGFGIECIDSKLMVSYPSIQKKAVADKILQEDMAEELRILYVALTRAKEKLIITASMKNAAKTLKKWQDCQGMAEEDVFSASCFMELLVKTVSSSPLCTLNLLESDYEEKEDIFEKITLKSKEPSEEITERLGFIYEDKISHIPSKVSVSELKEQLYNDALNLFENTQLKEPDFLKNEPKPTYIGTLIHKVMQLINIDKTNTLKEVEDEIARLTHLGIITKSDAEKIPSQKIYNFFTSKIGTRIKKADKVLREAPFTMPVPASLLTGNQEDFDETVIVQGIIDCIFFEGDKAVIVDYKTDKNTSREVILSRYKVQIDIYAMAASQKYFLKNLEKYIYLFENSDIIDVE